MAVQGAVSGGGYVLHAVSQFTLSYRHGRSSSERPTDALPESGAATERDASEVRS
ncbi:hypothetical protein [Streptomyces aureus]|uniref:hypothetical protein n=1 Tax=Streptomyces aureus TaxID=193461 RepID=UPI001FD829C0|nr:hypothetical protein [Streptomyces aureus]